MTDRAETDALIFDRIRNLPEKDKKEILDFIEFLKIREDRSFIDYVNRRTEAAINAKKRGEEFTALQELQRQYA